MYGDPGWCVICRRCCPSTACAPNSGVCRYRDARAGDLRPRFRAPSSLPATRSALEAAQQPPPVVPDSAPVAPDPAPVAPDPAPGPPETPSPPDGASPPAVDQVRAQPAPQRADAPPASAPVSRRRRRNQRAATHAKPGRGPPEQALDRGALVNGRPGRRGPPRASAGRPWSRN